MCACACGLVCGRMGCVFGVCMYFVVCVDCVWCVFYVRVFVWFVRLLVVCVGWVCVVFLCGVCVCVCVCAAFDLLSNDNFCQQYIFCVSKCFVFVTVIYSSVGQNGQ